MYKYVYDTLANKLYNNILELFLLWNGRIKCQLLNADRRTKHNIGMVIMTVSILWAESVFSVGYAGLSSKPWTSSRTTKLSNMESSVMPIISWVLKS